MSADADKQATPISVETVEEFSRWVEKREGQLLLYRGLADIKWEVESAAYRRIKEPEETLDTPLYIPGVFKNSIARLLDTAHMRGFRMHEGRELSDLELLARLQHFGAATCLIDFTRNPLVALWFACREQPEKDGKVVAMDTGADVTIPNLSGSSQLQSAFSTVGPEQLESKIEDFLYGKTLWKWEPSPWESRVIAQQSIFVFGQAKIYVLFEEARIPASAKESILHTLDKKFGVNEASLFGDFSGFALVNAHDKPYKADSADDYYEFADSLFEFGEQEKAIQYCDKAIAKNPEHIKAHFLRGRCNAALEKWKESIKDFSRTIEIDPMHIGALRFRGMAYEGGLDDLEKAVADYTAEIKFLSTNEGKHSSFHLVQAYNRRGEAYANMEEHEESIADFTSVIKIEPDRSSAYLERARSHRALGNENEAQADYKKVKKIEQRRRERFESRRRQQKSEEDT
ncbi:MAG: FRG domain-containing protein [Gammaproteobacteria bacterium]|nr:FRG domain-containing protein [Gammaproteobacteria bacterium]